MRKANKKYQNANRKQFNVDINEIQNKLYEAHKKRRKNALKYCHRGKNEKAKQQADAEVTVLQC